MESPVSSDINNSFAPAPKKSNTGLIIGIVVAVLLCCCCLIAAGVGGYYYTTRAVSDVYSSINEQLLTPVVPDIEIPTLPAIDPSNPSIPEMPEGVIPEGGLGDDLLRTDTWLYVNLAAVTQNCVVTDPSATEIEVITQPDSAGVWSEKWTVACDGGSKASFDVTFTPSAQGGTDISVSASK